MNARGRRAAIATVLGVVAGLVSGCDFGGPSEPELVWGIHGRKPGWIHKPRVAAFDAQDHLYMADLTDRIQVFDRDGTFLRTWSMPAFNVDGPSGLTIDRHGRLLVADTHFYRVLVYDRDGKIVLQIGDGVQGPTPGRFGYPTDVVIDKAGNFYVAEYGENDRIQVFSPEGKWLRQWGGHGYELKGVPPAEGSLEIDDEGISTSPTALNNRIQVFDTSGSSCRYWGEKGGQARPALLPVRPGDRAGQVAVCLRVRQQPRPEVHA